MASTNDVVPPAPGEAGAREDRERATPFLLIAAVLVGASVEIGLTTLTGRTEAFDSEKYLLAGYPVIGVTSGILAFIQPRRRFLWGVAPMLSQLMTMLSRSVPGSYWPVALAVSGIKEDMGRKGKVFLLAAFWTMASSLVLPESANAGGGVMTEAGKISVSLLPAIDRELPARTERAVFALG
jgi:hypothetical protein